MTKTSRKIQFQEQLERMQHNRMQRSQFKGMVVLSIIITLLIFWLSGCKSLEQKCADRFPPSVNSIREYRIEKTDTTLPRVTLNSVIDCPDFAQQIPKGKKLLLGEKDNVKLYASKGHNNELLLEAIREKSKIEQTKTTKSTSIENKTVITTPASKGEKESWIQRQLKPFISLLAFVVFGGLSGYIGYWIWLAILRKRKQAKKEDAEE